MEFPVTIYKGDAEYSVDNEESLEYHITQGWSLDKPEPVEPSAPVVPLTADSLDELRAEIKKTTDELHDQLAALTKRFDELAEALPNTEMIKGQGQLLAKLQGEVSKLSKGNTVKTVTAPPVPPPAPAPPVPPAE